MDGNNRPGSLTLLQIIGIFEPFKLFSRKSSINNKLFLYQRKKVSFHAKQY